MIQLICTGIVLIGFQKYRCKHAKINRGTGREILFGQNIKHKQVLE